MAERRQKGQVMTTVNEAAFVTGVTRHAINQAIDRREIRSWRLRRKTEPPGRAVGGPELIYLRVHIHLSPRARKEVYEQISGSTLEAMPQIIRFDGGGKLDIEDVVARVRDKLTELDRIRSQVEENAQIRGGEPVFRGTRIPVFMIADFLNEGVPREEILEDYPALTEDVLDIAPRYAELYPRRGRPRHAPWQAQIPTHVFRPEDLLEGERRRPAGE